MYWPVHVIVFSLLCAVCFVQAYTRPDRRFLYWHAYITLGLALAGVFNMAAQSHVK